MDRLAVIQDAIDRTQDAASRYRRPGVLEIFGTDLLTSRHQDPHGWTAGALQRLFLEIADDHDGCSDQRCRTCEALRSGLAVSLAALTGIQREELERRLKA